MNGHPQLTTLTLIEGACRHDSCEAPCCFPWKSTLAWQDMEWSTDPTHKPVQKMSCLTYDPRRTNFIMNCSCHTKPWSSWIQIYDSKITLKESVTKSMSPETMVVSLREKNPKCFDSNVYWTGNYFRVTVPRGGFTLFVLSPCAVFRKMSAHEEI